MYIENIKTLEDLKHFVKDNKTLVSSALGDKDERYQFIEKALTKFDYITLNKTDKGVVNTYIKKVSGYSRQQLTRLIKQYKDSGSIHWQPCRCNGFSTIYNLKDIKLLAEMDTRHDDICGHAVKKLMERAYNMFEQQEYNTLANISVSHLYNLRKSESYQQQRKHHTKTQPRKIAIAKRRKPRSNGQPGYIRIDTVFENDLDGHKGIYNINAIDEMTQFEVVCSVEQISERYLMPVLEQMIATFPFIIKEFYLDNDSEFINQHICKLLTKIQKELIKSRFRHSNNNSLAQSEKTSIIKQFSRQHVTQEMTPSINEFNIKYLYPYINYHRPCFFPVVNINKKGKPIKTYPYKNMMTPYEKLKSLPNAKKYLKAEVHFDRLDKQVMAMTDNTCAELLNKERNKLFSQIF